MEKLNRYRELYDRLVESRSTEKMKALGNASIWAFEKIEKTHPEIAQCWLDRIESSEWNNYLSPHEADEIVSGLINQNGKTGGMWSRDDIKSVLEANGLPMSEPPYYNFCALYATMNMIASDHWTSLSSIVGEEEMPVVIYKMAIEKLKDNDRPSFVRKYFDL